MPLAREQDGRTWRRRRLVGWLLAQAGLLAAMGIYLGHGGPLAPDRGLRQLDLISLREQVPGLGALDGRPTLVVAAGPQSDPKCAAQVALASSRRATPAGVGRGFALVVLMPGAGGTPVPSLPGLDGVRLDPGGETARRLALPRAAAGCTPGYAVLDAGGFVRYRTYDPAWGEHGQEQNVLLRSVGP
ncbi:MAG: hypothetical protein M3Z02_09345 [Actinomycetota bacterium]|nr:hypothetical protein [Actinomycetota bacterium]